MAKNIFLLYRVEELEELYTLIMSERVRQVMDLLTQWEECTAMFSSLAHHLFLPMLK